MPGCLDIFAGEKLHFWGCDQLVEKHFTSNDLLEMDTDIVMLGNDDH